VAADVRWHLPAGDSQANGEGEAALPPRFLYNIKGPCAQQLILLQLLAGKRMG
jgi:hypothetical protein